MPKHTKFRKCILKGAKFRGVGRGVIKCMKCGKFMKNEWICYKGGWPCHHCGKDLV